MKVLGVDTTGESLSVALSQDGAVKGEVFLDAGKKHSQTLMEAADSLLKLCGEEIADVDAFAAAVGPGSFTGIRIGVAAVSAFAYALNKPAYAVSTLCALLSNAGENETACAVMDARRGEVYAAARCGKEEIIAECAIPLVQLLEELISYDRVVFVGDAGVRYRDLIVKQKPDSLFLPQQFMLQHASAVCMCVHNGFAKEVEHHMLRPRYLRQSQAERLKGKR